MKLKCGSVQLVQWSHTLSALRSLSYRPRWVRRLHCRYVNYGFSPHFTRHHTRTPQARILPISSVRYPKDGEKTAKVDVVNRNALCSVHIAIGLHKIKSLFFNNAGVLTSKTYKLKKNTIRCSSSFTAAAV